MSFIPPKNKALHDKVAAALIALEKARREAQ